MLPILMDLKFNVHLKNEIKFEIRQKYRKLTKIF